MQLALVIFSALSFLLGSGALLKMISYSNKQAVQAYQHNVMKEEIGKANDAIVTLRTGQALTDQKLGTIESRLVKLDLIEVVHANVEHLKQMADNMLPRPEAEAKIKAVEDRVDTIAAVVFHK